MAQEYNYSDEFKIQICKLRENGKPISGIVKDRFVYFYTLKLPFIRVSKVSLLVK